MTAEQKDFCFCTLALGQRYRDISKELAKDLETNAPGISLVIYTEKPDDFSSYKNVMAFKHYQQGILHCYNDKRFLCQKAISLFPVAIYIDADTRILESLPEDIEWKPGITGRHKKLVEHVSKYRASSLPILKKLADKLNISDDSFNNSSWIGESLFIIVRDNGKEIEFLETWGKVSRYAELKGMHAGEGSLMGLAAAKVGWVINSEAWEKLTGITQHWDASRSKPKANSWDNLQKRMGYHYRLNKTRIMALRDFEFYYR
ncbi:hypothetical protein [Okeania sp. SIO2B3]|uniref:hypothetical protein n=1 Tax=Okeania sp. SIO2B3 TaxID=2607784 RepID=UPI0013C25076|nr:hypothetical protein [Okeania sp. SIO2B3]NET45308.1 hypothetical protein [Okeania sp. SIO2B3]